MNFGLVCWSVLLGCSVYAQTSHLDPDTLPDCPSTSKMLAREQAKNPGSAPTPEPPKQAEPTPAGQLHSGKKSQHVVDRNFLLGNLFAVGAMFAGIESLKYKISHGNGPGDSPYGTPPSRAELYGPAIPVTGASVAWSYHQKRKYPHSKRYILPPMMIGSAFAIKSIQTFASAKSSRATSDKPRAKE